MALYSDGGSARPFREWVRMLGSSEAFEAALRNGHIDEVSGTASLDDPPFM